MDVTSSEYDTIIVGAGSSGAVLAARLTEDPGQRCLLIDAGPDVRAGDIPREMRIPNPNHVQMLERYHRFRWPGLMARRTAAQQSRPYLRGRGVGGSSLVNGLVAIRGMLADFDDWAAQGCVGWSGKDVLPALVRLENDLDFDAAAYHGDSGPNPIYRTPVEAWAPVDLALRDAALDLGYGWSDDHNAPGSSGVSPYAINARDGLRVSVADAYLEPARDRDNLVILGNAQVDRVLFDGQRATGVRVRIDGAWVERHAREIILSAGAVHSPAILQRSGIGPREWLNSLGIPVIRELPAGQNLVDHPFAGVFLDLKPHARCTSVEARHTNCCVRYRSGIADAGDNDMILMSINLNGTDEAGLTTGLLGVSAFQTFSRGWLRITSRDPDDEPEIELRMLSDERDLLRMRDGSRRTFAIARQPAVAAIADKAWLWNTERVSVDALASDAALDDWLWTTVNDTFHPIGTCRMGAPDDPRSVVDPDCRVIGIERLRVIDAAIMPEIPRANTHITCVMLAELMAERMPEG